MKPLAFVIPWFGKELKGGAEQQVYQLSRRLAKRGHKVEILTTCCRSFLGDWSVNHLKAGTIIEDDGLTVRRFPVDRRKSIAFDELNERMLEIGIDKLKVGVSPVSLDDLAIFSKENINSAGLMRYLKNNRDKYRAFIFIPYLYGTTINGLDLVKDKAYIQPCLHDEVYAYLPSIEDTFRKAKGILYNSEGEELLAHKLYGPGIITKGAVVGEAVDKAQCSGNDNSDRIIALEGQRYVLYLGRRDRQKNIHTLLDAFANFKKYAPQSDLKLVLAGTGTELFNNYADGVIDLGLVSEDEKAYLLNNALALFQPSRNESFSRVIMEAWLSNRPVAVNSMCLATSAAVKKSKGGWLAETVDEWSALFKQIADTSADDLNALGQQGYNYASETASWQKV
ncbi:hexosyltransferase, partial [Candidatus Magnetoovum chiemensis]